MLSSKHIRTLTKIEKGKEIRDTKLNRDLEYLRKIGYIEMTVCDKKDDYFAMPYLTEMGMARLDIERKARNCNDQREVRIPLPKTQAIAGVVFAKRPPFFFAEIIWNADGHRSFHPFASFINVID